LAMGWKLYMLTLLQNWTPQPWIFNIKTKAGNLMQHKEPSPPKKPIVKHLICGKVIDCQKSLGFEK
jgi:hypothetical protein